MVALIDYVAELRKKQPECKVPDFDPAGGGVEARVLFLLEKPGPMTDPGSGSGFISIHNDDRTAAAIHKFLHERNIPYPWCLFANAIPWWDGRREISPQQRQLAKDAIGDLLELLPSLQAIVLLGGTAQRAWKQSDLGARLGVKLYRSLSLEAPTDAERRT
jgi:hypothetical protein